MWSEAPVLPRRTPLGVGRRANPFAAESHAPGAIDWLDASGRPDTATLDAILDRLADCHGSLVVGQITGAHGTGKSTLLTHVARRARERKWAVAESRPPNVAWPAWSGKSEGTTPRRMACIDSADQMSRARWELVKARARATRVILLLTTHRDLGGVDVAQPAMNVQIARRVLERMTQAWPIALPPDDELATMLDRHSNSLRHVIFELYDRFERGWPW